MSGVSKNFGVLYTGYLDKRNPVTGSYKKRFVVLTHESLHWFRRNEGYDLFGGFFEYGFILTVEKCKYFLYTQRSEGMSR